jgi:hypothetical protein
VHFMRNVLAHIPQGDKSMVAAVLRTFFAQPNRQAAGTLAMSPLDLLGDPLARAILLALWLLPCAIQGYRTRRVSNWLTMPLFLAAWPIAALTGNLSLTLATFAGAHAAFRFSGAASGRRTAGLPLGWRPQGAEMGDDDRRKRCDHGTWWSNADASVARIIIEN